MNNTRVQKESGLGAVSQVIMGIWFPQMRSRFWSVVFSLGINVCIVICDGLGWNDIKPDSLKYKGVGPDLVTNTSSDGVQVIDFILKYLLLLILLFTFFNRPVHISSMLLIYLLIRIPLGVLLLMTVYTRHCTHSY